LLVALDEPYAIDVGVTHHSVSIGVAASINPTDTADTLLKADCLWVMVVFIWLMMALQ
jgi:hypothetical protein